MEFNLQFELNLIWSKRKKLENIILKKYLSQLEKIYNSFRKDYFEQLYHSIGRVIPPGERRYFPTSSRHILLYKFININGFILVTIDGEEEKYFVDNLDQFLDIQVYLYQFIFQIHSNKLKKFDRKKNIKVTIQLEGIKRQLPPVFRRRLSI